VYAHGAFRSMCCILWCWLLYSVNKLVVDVGDVKYGAET